MTDLPDEETVLSSRRRGQEPEPDEETVLSSRRRGQEPEPDEETVLSSRRRGQEPEPDEETVLSYRRGGAASASVSESDDATILASRGAEDSDDLEVTRVVMRPPVPTPAPAPEEPDIDDTVVGGPAPAPAATAHPAVESRTSAPARRAQAPDVGDRTYAVRRGEPTRIERVAPPAQHADRPLDETARTASPRRGRLRAVGVIAAASLIAVASVVALVAVLSGGS